MLVKCLFFVAFLIFTPAVAWADIHTAASCSYSNVNSALAASSAGDTVAIPAGTCTWGSTLTITKSITLQGAGAQTGGTHIDMQGNGAGNPLVVISPSSDVPIRITGIYFDAVSSSTGTNRQAIVIYTDVNAKLSQIRIDHCTFNQGNHVVNPNGWVYGVIDNNKFINCDECVRFDGGDDNGFSWTREPIAAGTANAMFIEDNNFIFDNNALGEDLNELLYHNYGPRSVFRYNIVDFTAYTKGDALVFDAHGGSPYISVAIGEYYNNRISIDHSYRVGKNRGGGWIWHDNVYTAASGGCTLELTDDDNTGSTWPGAYQIYNSFFWNNTGLTVAVVPQSGANLAKIHQDRDYFLHAPQASGGKETVTLNPYHMTFSSSGANAYYPYTPYTYPHPLRTGESQPSPPKNLRIVN